MSVIIDKKAKRKIDDIFEHPNNIYSVYIKNGDVKWIDGKINLYEFLRKISQ